MKVKNIETGFIFDINIEDIIKYSENPKFEILELNDAEQQILIDNEKPVINPKITTVLNNDDLNKVKKKVPRKRKK